MSPYRHVVLLAVAVVALGVVMTAQGPQSYKGLEVSVSGVARAGNVSLADCPAGANIVRGVIKPGDPMEFASVTADFKVIPGSTPGVVPKPVLYDAAGKAYNTAQSFGDMAATPAFSCTFSFRVPKGTKVSRFTIDTLSIDLGSMGQ